MQTGYTLSAFSLIAYTMLSNNVQLQLQKFAPSSIAMPFKDWRFVPDETLFSHWGWPVIFCVTYLVLIFALKAYMRNRPAMDLYWLRVTHNTFLCFGSFMMLLGFVKNLYIVYERAGVEPLVCDVDKEQTKGDLYFWYYVFYLSKFYEFIDTGILIARKKQITFLHCFHHFITAIICWMGVVTTMSIQWIVVSLNATVHVFMYYYFLVQTVGGDVWWKKHLTSMQIIQFVVDLIGLNAWWYNYYGLGKDCSGHPPTLAFATLILTSFLILFLNFYIKTYRQKAAGRTATVKKQE